MKKKKKKKEKLLVYHHFTQVYQKTQSGTVPEIRSETNIFLSFWTIFCPLIPPVTPQKTNILKK